MCWAGCGPRAAVLTDARSCVRLSLYPPTWDLFDGPVSLMLAKTPDPIPRPGPGGDLAFEPNWDGTRGDSSVMALEGPVVQLLEQLGQIGTFVGGQRGEMVRSGGGAGGVDFSEQRSAMGG